MKNTDGSLGPICNNCGGYGFTHTVFNNGADAGCIHCKGTGIDKDKQTEERFQRIEAALQAISEALGVKR